MKFGFIFVREMAWNKCRDCRLSLAFDSRWTCNGKNSSEFMRTVAMMHMSSSWMFEEEGLSRGLTGCSSGVKERRMRSGGKKW
jgi:hypothetical protein